VGPHPLGGAILGLGLALLAACGPIPGGSLSGNVRQAPSAWTAVLEDGKGFCEIESRPADPHSIQLECFVYEGALYAQSHRWALESWWPVESWAAVWLEHPDVRVRIDDAIYELRAVRVADASVRDPVLKLRGYEPPPDGIVLFRFDPRA
jgi:hypothetical protein